MCVWGGACVRACVHVCVRVATYVARVLSWSVASSGWCCAGVGKNIYLFMQALGSSVYCLLINCCGHLFHDLTDLLASARLLERVTHFRLGIRSLWSHCCVDGSQSSWSEYFYSTRIEYFNKLRWRHPTSPLYHVCVLLSIVFISFNLIYILCLSHRVSYCFISFNIACL